MTKAKSKDKEKGTTKTTTKVEVKAPENPETPAEVEVAEPEAVGETDQKAPETSEVAPENEEKSATAKEKTESDGPRYAFPSVSCCPRCGANDTQATSTQGNTQYRKCVRGVCRRRYSVMGELVKKKRKF